MGTDKFALPTLQKIYLNNDFEIVAIYTKEPAIAGRGQKINYSDIHQFALKNNLKVLTPKNFKEPSAIAEFNEFKADIAIVISYGLILPDKILSGTKFGCFNIHPSNLPLYRGPSPLQSTLLNGEKNSAICIIKMDQGVDSGDIVNKIDFSIADYDDFANISSFTANSGAELLIKTLYQIKDNNLSFTPQNHKLATFTKKINKDDAKINWHENAQDIFNKIRALNGNLGAYFEYDNEKIKILKAEYLSAKNQNHQSGTILDKNFSVKCQNGVIFPKILQRAGKKPLNLNEFLNGFKPEIGKIL